MDKKFAIIQILLVNVVFWSMLIVDVNSQITGWSSWTDCTELSGCFRRRTFTCDAGEGIECLNEADGSFEQVTVNCDASLECLENVEEMFYASEVSGFLFAVLCVE